MKDTKSKASKDVKKHDAGSSNIITLDEFKFPHGVYIFDGSVLKDDVLNNAYSKLYMHLTLDNHPDVGITVIITPKWMLLTTLAGPYTQHRGYPVYTDAYAYCGIFNIQTTEHQWPATAGLEDDTLSAFEVLERSSQLQREEHAKILILTQ